MNEHDAQRQPGTPPTVRPVQARLWWFAHDEETMTVFVEETLQMALPIHNQFMPMAYGIVCGQAYVRRADLPGLARRYQQEWGYFEPRAARIVQVHTPSGPEYLAVCLIEDWWVLRELPATADEEEAQQYPAIGAG